MDHADTATEAAPTAEAERFPLAPAPAWTLRWTNFVVLFAVGATALTSWLPPATRVTSLAVSAGLLVAAFAFRRARLRQQPETLELTDDAVTVPGPLLRPTLRLPLEALTGAYLVGGPRPGLVLSTANDVVVVPAVRFAEPQDAIRAMESVLRRLRASPAGLARLERMAAALREEAALQQRPATFSMGLAFAIIAVFVAETASGALDQPLGMVRLGGSSGPLDWVQPWRLATAPFLHAGGLHLLVNLIALTSLGPALERLLGWPRFVLVYLASAFAGAALSALGGNVQSVGASGALFGLLGALAVVQLRLGSDLPPGFRQSRRAWLTIAAVNGGLALLPFVDWRAHVGGLVAGSLAALVLVRRGPARELARPSLVLEGLAAALAVATTLVLAYGAAQVTRALEPAGDAPDLALLTARRPEPVVQNGAAWQLATEPDATRASLEQAAADARRALDATKDPSIQDTLALATFRLGRADEALSLERDALARALRAPDRTPEVVNELATMLTRFELAALGDAMATAPASVATLADGSCELRPASGSREAFTIEAALLDSAGEPIARARFAATPPFDAAYVAAPPTNQRVVSCRILSSEPGAAQRSVEVIDLDPATLKLPLAQPRG